MVRLHVSGTGFVDENVLQFIDEGHSLRDPATGVTRNVGALADELAEAVNALCADGVSLVNVEKVCAAICRFVSLVEELAFVEGAVAQRDGKRIVRTQTVDERKWNCTEISNFEED